MRPIFLLSAIFCSVFVNAQSDQVNEAADIIYNNNYESWCTAWLPPVTRTRISTIRVNARTATVARSTATRNVGVTRTVTAVVTTTVTRTSTVTTTAPARLARRQAPAGRPAKPAALARFSDAVLTEACLFFVQPRTATVVQRNTRTFAARTVTILVTTSAISSPTTVTRTATSTATAVVTATHTVNPPSGNTPPPSPPPPSGAGSVDADNDRGNEESIAGDVVPSGASQCRDFTGNGQIAIGVHQYSFSTPVGKEAYVIDWNVKNAQDCCNRCFSSAMGCAFWRFADSCLIIANPTRANQCAATRPVVTVTTGGKDSDSMAGPGGCGWQIQRARL
ncbi:hypothetical protein BZA77DRAFT_14472 [Pyronema omphalodes]|nr:hypothetical protein BZA77DRAFT_14472 [Pyronema omphalodes]